MSVTIDRLKRFVTLVKKVYEDSGSTSTAASFAFRFLYKKFPILASHVFYRITRFVRVRKRTANVDHALHAPQIAIKVSGGLGDYIVAARFLRDLLRTIEPCDIYIYANSVPISQWILSGLSGYQESYPDTVFHIDRDSYDLALSVNTTVTVHAGPISPSIRNAPKLLGIRARILSYKKSIAPFIEHHPRLDNGLARLAVFKGHSRRDFLHAIAGISYGGDLMDIEISITAMTSSVSGKRYITIHNGFDHNFVISGIRATKCYPHFDEVVAGIKRSFPDILIIQIGTHTSEHLAGVDMDLINKTSLPEAAARIRGAILHIDNEGGLVHLASCFGVHSCVVFGPTPSAYFPYPI